MQSAKKATTLTAKAIIHQKYGEKACYTIQELELPPQNGCPGLSLPQKGTCLFRCSLQLPEFSVVSEPCNNKKLAQQSAAQLALLKLGIDPHSSRPTVSDASDELVSRLSHMFSDEFLSSLHPLSGHLKAVLRREGELSGLLPISAVIACDSKVGNLCKLIDARVESNPYLSIPIIKRAAVRLSESIIVSEKELWIRRKQFDPCNLLPTFVNQQSDLTSGDSAEAVYIPVSLDKDISSIRLNCSKGYYLDHIAQELGVVNASNVLMSRTIGKASSEMRLYFSALEANNLAPGTAFDDAKELSCLDSSFNTRASYLLGQHVYGNAILASLGYTWRGADLYIEDVSPRSYFRILLCKTPDGLFKLSREAVLVADLPVLFTTKTNWRGSLPRDLLCALCRQHRLSEPVFTVFSNSPKSDQEFPESYKKLVARGSNIGVISENGGAPATDSKSLGTETFRCEIKVCAKNEDIILECSPIQSFKKQGDAVQNASLKVLLWFNMYFKQPSMCIEKLCFHGVEQDIQCHFTRFSKEFSLCQLILNVQQRNDLVGCQNVHLKPMDMQTDSVGFKNKLSIQGAGGGSSPSNGFLVCISYTVHLVSEGKEIQEILERSDEFEFEIGSGAVVSCIEAAVLHMTAGQSTSFILRMPPKEFVFAATMDFQKVLSCLSSKTCFLEYAITLLRVTEPLEDRMEQALFSPPLSKQRVEFAMQCIKEVSATSLIDFGCGSGSLLDSLLDTPSSLENIIGVDISQKGLIRAAKVLNSKIEKLKAMQPTSKLKSTVLYEGSITVFDSRLYGCDIGTCLEVIEHMEEEQACLFGDIALGRFRPSVLVVSTPNYEYNVILQGSNLAISEDESDENAQSQSCKFRNHDHKFEWTREQFQKWATRLALKYNYSVEFSGVGGIHGVEPGFASQIAVFRSSRHQYVEESEMKMEADHHYETLWEWNATSTLSCSDSVEAVGKRDATTTVS